ncbi:NPP1-domain-containing protein [Pleurostoma richardsiae]|uniref:NPP1-domain-containing protein n=1 Tax=Pleurostoma richardsiae TaxID=41990 RepID=A0AA38RCR2_9PEZI|nr:NPP1-domain-containing protein [Pleurostoma richardsiae]
MPSSVSDASPALARRVADPPSALPQNATEDDLHWQPSLDFDKNGCYNVPAIDADGNVAKGLPHSWVDTASDCRDPSDLDNNNVYSRSRCNRGWCVYMYDYYFEKDVATPYSADTGHTHDWEHIAVWVKDNLAHYVAVSQHGGYSVRRARDVRWDGSHPKVVYHKDGRLTHCFRFARKADDAIENDRGVWFRGDLVSYNGFPAHADMELGIRHLLYSSDFGAGHIAIKDPAFVGNLHRALPGGITTFDTGVDVGSPGIPGVR